MQTTVQYCAGIVKQVLSGDAVVIRGKQTRGPPPEATLYLSNVAAPKLGRRGTQRAPEPLDDEPYAWESREFLRKKIIGKECLFAVETETPTGRKYGNLFLGKDIKSSENITKYMLTHGMLKTRQEGRIDPELVKLEEDSKTKKLGMFAGDSENHVRTIMWNAEEAKAFAEKIKGKKTKAIIEHVRDGSTIRAFLLPEFCHVTVMLSGIRCPIVKLDSEGRVDHTNSEKFAEEARFFVESRLLQREVFVVVESINNNNIVGSVLHPVNGNIAEHLLKEGYGKCIDWSISNVTGGAEALRKAEKSAKEGKRRLWSNYKPPVHQTNGKGRVFTGVCIEVINGDALMIKQNNGKVQKIFLASIRPPRSLDENQKGKGFRPLYDVPWMFEAREFLRKRLIGQKVQVTVEFVQPPSNNFAEKHCCTVIHNNENVGEVVVSAGFATVVKYRQDDDQRASNYDDLVCAEAAALKEAKGIHAPKKETPIYRIKDLSGDVAKSKSFFPFLQRVGMVDALVEFVASGSRLRLYIQRETCLLTFLLSGISCPRGSRPAPSGTGIIEGEKFGAEALAFTKGLTHQKDVQIEVESLDRGGNFIGWLHVDGKNLSVLLVEQGLSTVHNTAETSKFYPQLSSAEKKAIDKKVNLFATYVEEKKVEQVEEAPAERKIDYKSMLISEVTSDGKLFGQYCSEGQDLVTLMSNLTTEFSQNKPVEGAYNPMKGQLCAAKFIDGNWYRAKVEKISGKKCNILYIDYGNRTTLLAKECAPLPARFITNTAFAHEMSLAFVKYHSDDDYMEDAISTLMQEVMDKQVKVNVEYKLNGLPVVTMQRADDEQDIAKLLLGQGLLMTEKKRDERFKSLVAEYVEAEKNARKQHLNIWQYGDVTEDDSTEFGMER